MKKLGFGMMRLPLLDAGDEGSIDMEQTKRMVDLFLERGFTYFDTAWMYCGFKSEQAVKAALVDRHPRESFTLADKLHCAFLNTPEDRDRIFSEQLRKTGAGFFDYYLLHGIEADSYPKYEKYQCFDWLLEKKARGLVRHAGFSFHDGPELLDRILTEHPQMEFVQLQINYLDWDSKFVRSRACYEVAERHGKSVVVMEPVKGGTLAALPETARTLLRGFAPEASEASWAVRFAASLPNVMVVLSGMSDMRQMEDNTGYMRDMAPFTAQEREMVMQAARIIQGQIAVPCTGCSYCTEGCPMHIAIPKYFSLYNERMREEGNTGWSSLNTAYDLLTGRGGAPADCVACGQCEGVCPQHLPVIRYLKMVDECFGSK